MQSLQTLGEKLIHHRAPVTASQYEAARALDPRQGASWAVWGATTGDLALFDDVATIVPRLRNDVVLIAANFGLGGDTGEFAPFRNFHASSSGGDSKLRRGITGTPLEGAFLTDIVKDFPTKYADGLARGITEGAIDVDNHIRRGFDQERDALGLTDETLYIPIGGNSRSIWDLLVRMGVLPRGQRVLHREYSPATSKRGTPVLELPHYSNAVNMTAAVQSLLARTRMTS